MEKSFLPENLFFSSSSSSSSSSFSSSFLFRIFLLPSSGAVATQWCYNATAVAATPSAFPPASYGRIYARSSFLYSLHELTSSQKGYDGISSNVLSF